MNKEQIKVTGSIFGKAVLAQLAEPATYTNASIVGIVIGVVTQDPDKWLKATVGAISAQLVGNGVINVFNNADVIHDSKYVIESEKCKDI